MLKYSMAKNLSFSYSKMTLYRECPQKYKFRYVYKIPEKPKYYFAFGQSMHKALEYLYGVKQPPFPTLEQLLNFFDADWRATAFEEKGYASVTKELEGYDEGRRILVSYYQKHAANLFTPLAVEFKTTLDIDSLALISIIDRVDYLGAGRVAITDYKTGKTVDREPDQLYMYQKVLENSPVLRELVKAKEDGAKEVKVEKLSFYHLPSLKVMDFEPAPEKEINVFWQSVLKTADEIRSEIYKPAPEESKCRWCDYKAVCPVFTGVEFENLQKTPPPSASAPADDLAGKIDELGKKQKEIKTLEAEIIKIMSAQNYNHHFGKHFKASLENKKTLQFTDEQAVVDLLKEYGLLNKTLVPTMSSITAVLKDSSAPKELKDAVKKLSKMVPDAKLIIEESKE